MPLVPRQAAAARLAKTAQSSVQQSVRLSVVVAAVADLQSPVQQKMSVSAAAKTAVAAAVADLQSPGQQRIYVSVTVAAAAAAAVLQTRLWLLCCQQGLLTGHMQAGAGLAYLFVKHHVL